MESKTQNEVAAEIETVTTEVKADTEKKRTSTKEIIAYLAEKFPGCFSLEGQVKPLKVGIFQELAEQLADDETVSKTRLRQALRHYTSSWRYLKSIKKGAFRIDITGSEVAEIDQEQADYASKTLKESQEKFGNKINKDKPAKKPYKGNNKDKSASEKAAKKPAKDNAKFNAVKAKKQAPAKAAVKLKPIDDSALKVGSKVKVQLGNSPLDAVITEVAGKDVSVQLNSGMVVKTQAKNIFTE